MFLIDSPTMLVQIDDLPQYDGADMLERDREVLEEEEVICEMMEKRTMSWSSR